MYLQPSNDCQLWKVYPIDILLTSSLREYINVLIVKKEEKECCNVDEQKRKLLWQFGLYFNTKLRDFSISGPDNVNHLRIAIVFKDNGHKCTMRVSRIISN